MVSYKVHVLSFLSSPPPKKKKKIHQRDLVTVASNLLKTYAVAFLEGPEMVQAESFPWTVFLAVFHKNLALRHLRT